MPRKRARSGRRRVQLPSLRRLQLGPGPRRAELRRRAAGRRREARAAASSTTSRPTSATWRSGWLRPRAPPETPARVARGTPSATSGLAITRCLLVAGRRGRGPARPGALRRTVQRGIRSQRPLTRTRLTSPCRTTEPALGVPWPRRSRRHPRGDGRWPRPYLRAAGDEHALSDELAWIVRELLRPDHERASREQQVAPANPRIVQYSKPGPARSDEYLDIRVCAPIISVYTRIVSRLEGPWSLRS